MPRLHRRRAGDGIGATSTLGAQFGNSRSSTCASSFPSASATSCHALPLTRWTRRSSGGAYRPSRMKPSKSGRFRHRPHMRQAAGSFPSSAGGPSCSDRPQPLHQGSLPHSASASHTAPSASGRVRPRIILSKHASSPRRRCSQVRIDGPSMTAPHARGVRRCRFSERSPRFRPRPSCEARTGGCRRVAGTPPRPAYRPDTAP